MAERQLARIPAEGRIAGVCAGLANYLDMDVVLVRAAWVVFSIVPGALIGGVIAYIAAWMIMPVSTEAAAPRPNRLTRSETDKKIAGVCGGLAEYFGVDATAVRLVWAILSIVCGAVIGGVLAYLAAWFIIPRASSVAVPTGVATA
jgi:phage shock protein PspC (stress-responsive transcriptional regulator)